MGLVVVAVFATWALMTSRNDSPFRTTRTEKTIKSKIEPMKTTTANTTVIVEKNEMTAKQTNKQTNKSMPTYSKVPPTTTRSSSIDPTHTKHWWTYHLTTTIIPLVEPTPDGQEQINHHTKEPIFYKPDVGYTFPVNGQGGKWGNHFYPASVLNAKLEPDKVLTKQDAVECLSLNHNITWIHNDGDSLARDVYYDLTELYGMDWNNKEKSLDNLRMDSNTNIKFTFSSDTIKFGRTPNWFDKNNPTKVPDVWIYSSGLWDHPANTTNEEYYNRTKALADFVLNHPSGRNITHKILRYTTPYQLKDRFPLNNRAKVYNQIATDLLVVGAGFRYVDTFEILEPRKDLSHDGVHYTGPGSKWVTNSILNLICP